MAPKVALPTVTIPKVTIPKVTLPKITVPSMPTIDERLTSALRDAAYITVGIGVLAVQQADARRRDLVHVLAERFDTSKAQIEELLSTVEAQLRTADTKVKAASKAAITKVK
jgi:hypothetical protein